MNSTATPPTPTDAAAHFAWWLDAVFAPLAILVAARFRLLGHWTVPLWTRLTRANRRLAKLLAHLAAGGTFRPATPRNRAPRSGRHPPIRIPTRRAWLVILLRHEAAAYMLRLETVLNHPATSALLAANPAAARRIARTLAPFCHLLGVTNPHAPPRAPRAPRRRRPRPRAATIPKPARSRARAEPPPALTADGYMIPPSASPPAWPPTPRLAPNFLLKLPPAPPPKPPPTRSRDRPPASPSRGTRPR